jgi:alkyl sulfatase BDS1-like metallo-beta-lactamase superfamily hydrolase
MTDKQPQLDYDSAKGREMEAAAFYYRGAPQVVTDGVVFFPNQGNCSAFLCGDRILLVDTNPQWFVGRTVETLRAQHSEAPVQAIVYTHGHIDHVTGAASWIADAQQRGYNRPHVVAHRDLPRRFDRYQLLADQNNFINRVQFNLPENVNAWNTVTWTYPDQTYDGALTMSVEGEHFELYHARGETDDETWVWNPNRRVLCTGDTFVWSSPNAGNPYKVQRYAIDWANALEQMAALRPAFLLPGHGPVLAGEERIQDGLLSTAHFLRSIHDQVVTKMNEGKWLEDILREIDYPPTDKPWLQPIYDHPEFIARNVYRLYGGWYDGDPANILPAHSHDIAEQLVTATGSEKILDRARKLRDDGDLQMACHMVDVVRKGEPDNIEAWKLWRELFAARAEVERSLMARGAFHYATRLADDALRRLGQA